jgi:ParB family transcriptional regulator, chromosome partitioning protein
VDDKRRALGRGLASLLPAARAVESPAAAATAVSVMQPEGETVREIPVGNIDRNPYQTRSRFDDVALHELAASIKANGIMQPVVVRTVADGRYQLIAGERRWLASQKAGKATVPAIVREVSNEQALEMTIVENLQREDLGAMEQARAFERLSREFSLTQEQIAQRTGKDRSVIANYIRLLKLPFEIQAEIETGAISFGHAKVLLMLDSPEAMQKVAHRIAEQGISVRETEALVHNILYPAGKKAEAGGTRAVDPNVREAERQLQQVLGLKVEIHDRKGKGKIVLQYASLEDFDRILEVLGQGR